MSIAWDMDAEEVEGRWGYSTGDSIDESVRVAPVAAIVETLRAEQARYKTPFVNKVIDYIEREFGGGS